MANLEDAWPSNNLTVNRPFQWVENMSARKVSSNFFFAFMLRLHPRSLSHATS